MKTELADDVITILSTYMLTEGVSIRVTKDELRKIPKMVQFYITLDSDSATLHCNTVAVNEEEK